MISSWGNLRRSTSVMLYTSWLKSEVNISDNRPSVEMISQQWRKNSWYNQDSVTSCAKHKECDHLMQQQDQNIYTPSSYSAQILRGEVSECCLCVCACVCVYGCGGGHARIQLLGMRPQMEMTLHYLVLIKEAINSLCVKSITAALLRQNKYTALEREKCLKIKTHAGESWGKVEWRSARLGAAHSNELIVKREGVKERETFLLCRPRSLLTTWHIVGRRWAMACF